MINRNEGPTEVSMSIEKNLQAITDGKSGMDIVIVSTTSEDQEVFWQERLDRGRGQICAADAKILAVHEDWPGGAGNGLGTLYAIANASLKAKKVYGIDLLAELRDGASVGLYHTAGKGTRLAPLPGSECNNKPAVKLPSVVEIDKRHVPLTILEAVIRQTAIYAPSRKARISVFWGDQVFIPSVSAEYDAVHHVDILAQLGPMPDAQKWVEEGLEKYGLIAVAANGDAAQVEKITHDTATALMADGVIETDGGIGASLGSFSISSAMTEALLHEFAHELAEKQEKFDTDPHFWMPMTLDEATYLKMMAQKDVPEAEAKAHYERMQAFLDTYHGRNPDARIFGCVNVGTEGYWWDYGTVTDYITNNLKLLDDDAEGKAMRQFYKIDKRVTENTLGPEVEVDDRSIVIGCNIKSGEISNSVLINVTTERADIDKSLLINVAALDLAGEELLLYNVAEELSLQLDEETVRADAFVPGVGHLPMWSFLSRDGKEDWDEKLEGNGLSYGELHKANQGVSMREVKEMTDEAFQTIINKLTVQLR